MTKKAHLFITDRKRSCGKVMFLHLSVILFTRGEGGVLSSGVSVKVGSLSRGVTAQGVSVTEIPPRTVEERAVRIILKSIQDNR